MFTAKAEDLRSPSREVICLSIHTNLIDLCYAKGHSFRTLLAKEPPWKPWAFCLVSLQLLPAWGWQALSKSQGLNLAPLQCKEWHLQWHLPKKSLGRQSISGMLWHDFLPVSFLLPNATNLLQAFISIELLPCQLQLGCSSQSVRKQRPWPLYLPSAPYPTCSLPTCSQQITGWGATVLLHVTLSLE